MNECMNENIAFQSKADHPNMIYIHTFCSCDLDLDPMTLIYERNLENLKMYLLTKSEISRLID